MKKLTKSQMRVAIAKDVLKQIKAGKFRITVGRFAVLPGGSETYGKKELRKMPVCNVCAIGAAIVSGIRLFNEIEITDSCINNKESWEMIQKFFSPTQAIKIENAFEQGSGCYSRSNWDWTGPDVNTDKAVDFGESFQNKTARAYAIFANIVKNNGEFKP
jgi:hypothetical protein